MREFPLGFYQWIPGSAPLSRKQAKKEIKKFKKELLRYLTDCAYQLPNLPQRGGVGAVDVISRPQIVFKGERLVVPSNIAADFAIIDVKVGNRSQLANSTALPAQVFCETAIGVRLALDVAVVAQDIALVVENVSDHDETFMAALIGTAVQ